MHFTAAPTVTLQQLCDPSAPTMSLMLYATVLSIALWIPFYKHLCLKPYPGIPYNHAAAKRISSDLPDLLGHHKRTKEASSYSFQQCRKLRSPIVQIFPTSVLPAPRLPRRSARNGRHYAPPDERVRRRPEHDRLLQARGPARHARSTVESTLKHQGRL